jgi:hypothetical protein
MMSGQSITPMPFCVTVPPAHLFITTRNAEVVVGLGAEEHGVNVLSPGDSLRLLAGWAGKLNPSELPPQATEIAHECGCLPLAWRSLARWRACGLAVGMTPSHWKRRNAASDACESNYPDVSGEIFPPLLLSVAVSPRPFGQIGHFDRLLSYLIEVGFCIPSGLTICLPRRRGDQQ